MRHHPVLTRLGTTVRSLREGRGWSRREFAVHTGISERFLADVEAGRANPSVLKLVEIARALEVPLPQLLASAATGAEAGRTRHVALLGLRGAGKSTVGPRLAERLGRPFVELDARVEAATGLELSAMFQLHGEDYYRKAERTALEQLLGEPEACVVAVGGGLVAEPASFALLRSRTLTVWLRAEPKEHWQRVLEQGDTRPMADNEKAFADLRRILATREPFYRMADLTVDTSARAVGDVVDELAARLRDATGEANEAGEAGEAGA